MNIGFVVLMIATPAFYRQPFITGTHFDPVGVFFRFLQRENGASLGRLLGVTALESAVGIFFLMVLYLRIGGLVLRLMFLIVNLW